jgi:hypothetical protein
MSTKLSTLLALTAALAIAVGFSVRAQRSGERRRNRIPENSQTLESLKRLRCSFSAATSGVWESGSTQARTKEQPNGALIVINDIDVQDGTAEIGGSFRGSNVNVKLAGSTLHFLDIGLNGSLTVISVFARETHDGRLQAVYSHAAYVPSGPGATTTPEGTQYYGDCEAGR